MATGKKKILKLKIHLYFYKKFIDFKYKLLTFVVIYDSNNLQFVKLFDRLCNESANELNIHWASVNEMHDSSCQNFTKGNNKSPSIKYTK